MKDNFRAKFILLTILCVLVFISSVMSNVLWFAIVDFIIWLVLSIVLAVKRYHYNKQQEEITKEIYKDIQQRKKEK